MLHELPMECHITDGPQTPEEALESIFPDEDDAYERIRQAEIDDESFANGADN